MKYHQLTPSQQTIFDDLMALCAVNEGFYFQDFPADEDEGTVFRIFNYRQASYTDFCQSSARECRGSMFEVSDYGTPIRMAARPDAKFFNVNENPFTMMKDLFADDPLLHLEESNDKADGSLISSFIGADHLLALKSKGSPNSEQAQASMAWIDENNFLYDEVMMLTQNGWTVNFEWCAPDNRIVLSYETGHLQVLNIRNNETGEHMPRREIGICAPEVKKHMVELKFPPKADTFEEMMDLVRAETGIEGYIFKFGDVWAKAKTDWYKTRHHCKDSVTVPRRLFEVCVQSDTDDLKDMFGTDPEALKLIEEMEDFVRPLYNGICNRVETFYDDNHHRDQKEYAIIAQQVLDKQMGEFGLAMALYNGKEIDYKSNLIKKWKILGLKDEKVLPE